MQELHVAISGDSSTKYCLRWDERSAGAWRKHVRVHPLTSDKNINDGIVANLAKSPNTLILAPQHLTSLQATDYYINIKRLKSYQIERAVDDWIEKHDLDWRSRTEKYCKKTAFKCISGEEWVSQFAKVDPLIGRRAGAALLAQFYVAGDMDFAQYFSGLPEVDVEAIFYGADPHSGDLALVHILSAIKDNSRLVDSRKIPSLKNGKKVRLYGDGSWSGGETQRRIRCMYTSCAKKENALNSTQSLDVRLGFLTDAAERKISREIESLDMDGLAIKGNIQVFCPPSNRFFINGFNTAQKGLAFHDSNILDYVDPNRRALRNLCEKIGKQLSSKPLGTNEIASCIAFSHSLPAAMLPLFTVDGVKVTGANNETFVWKALMRSEHALTGQPDASDYHCDVCPLADR